MNETFCYQQLERTIALRRGEPGLNISAATVAAEIGVAKRTINRWRAKNELSVNQADRAACALGLHPCEVWPEFLLGAA